MEPFGQSPPRVRGPLPGAAGRAWVEELARTECPALTARRARRAERTGAPHDPIVWTEARGANVRDADGNVFVDFTAGFGVAAAGHGHPRIVAAIERQSRRLVHGLGDVHPSDAKLGFLSALAERAPYEDPRILLGLNGSDAVAAALKTALLATGRPGVLAFEGGYHGLMYGPLALCGYAPKFRQPFAAQLSPTVSFAPYPRGPGDVERVWEALDGVSDLGAVVLEPALARGGIRFLPEGFWEALRARVHARGGLLVADEIYVGLGRTGRYFAHPEGAPPDLLCLGKALGGGMPISALVGPAAVLEAWGDPAGEALHTATFAGHPVACAAGRAALEILEEEGLVERAATVGARFRDRLAAALPTYEVRGRGLMVGVEIGDGDRTLALLRRLLERGYLALPAGAGAEVLALTPPLVIGEALLDAFVAVLHEELR
jgi:4-aminobutyrate aminotransferase-like enzyme